MRLILYCCIVAKPAIGFLITVPQRRIAFQATTLEDFGGIILEGVKDVIESFALAASPLFRSDDSVQADEIVQTCDALDRLDGENSDDSIITVTSFLRRRALEYKRYELLAKLMRKDYDAYTATASFLSPSRIPRLQLPNLQDVPFDETLSSKQQVTENDLVLLADCELEEMEYQDSVLDKILLSIFRKLVVQNTGGVTSDKDGFLGLVEQARTYLLQATPDDQNKMVRETLAGLMTPVLPPFYRIFMSGIVPKIGSEWDGKQIGPWFYAPWLTSIVTPTFFGFLVGPSYPNRRKDGHVGGIVVEKCKFLQESKCKGICLHMCKLPAQQFFQDELGLPLAVSPNFVTQECQWSFGEAPVPVEEDDSFPKGCLVGCESRKVVAEMQGAARANLCN